MNERDLTADFDKYLKGRIREGAPLWYLKVHGGPYQRVGVPDYLLCIAGWFGAIEFKHPDEAPVPSPKQAREIAKMVKAWGTVTTVNRVADATALVEGLLRRAGGSVASYRAAAEEKN